MNIIKIDGNCIGISIYTYNNGWLSNVKNKEKYQYCKINSNGTVEYHSGKIYQERERIAVVPQLSLEQKYINTNNRIGFINHDGEMVQERDNCINPSVPKNLNYESLVTKEDSLLFKHFECKPGEVPIVLGNKKENKTTLFCIPSGIFKPYIDWKCSIGVVFSYDYLTLLVHQAGHNQLVILDNPVYQ